MDTLQEQLIELKSTDNVNEMIDKINAVKQGKLSNEDRTVVNIVGLLVPFLISSKVSKSHKKIEVAVEKNANNVRLLAYSNEKLEQYTRRDNLRLFNFPSCEDTVLSDKFIELESVLGLKLRLTSMLFTHCYPQVETRS